MTCIIALRNRNRKIIVCADRRQTSSYVKESVAVPKIIKRDGMILGVTGTLHTGQLISHMMKIPKQKANMTDLTYIQQTVHNKIVSMLKKYNLLTEHNRLIGEEHVLNLLIVYKSRAYNVYISDEESLTILPSSLPLCLGSGACWAQGALYVNQRKAPIKRLLEAQKAAAEFDPNCGDGVDLLAED